MSDLQTESQAPQVADDTASPVPPAAGPTPTASDADSPDSLRALGSQIREKALADQQGVDTPTIVDVGRGVLNAPFHLISNVGALGADVLRTGVETATGNEHPEISVDQWNPLGDTQTTLGGLSQGVTEMAIGMAISGGALRAAGVADGLSALKYGKALTHLTQGALADTFVFGAHDKRLSDLLVQYPALNNPVTRFLQSKDTDGVFYSRLKNVLEGAGVGSITGLAFKLFSGSKAIRAAQAAGGPAAASDAAAKVAQELQPEIEAYLKGEKDFSGIDDNTAKAVMIRANGMDPAHADAALKALKTVAGENGVQWTDLMKGEVLDVRRRLKDVYQSAADVADKFRADGVTADSPQGQALNEAAKVVMNEPHPGIFGPDGKVTGNSTTLWAFQKRMEGWLDNLNPVPVVVRNVDDLKSLYTLVGGSGRDAEDALSAAAEKAGVRGQDLDSVLSSGVPVTAQDLKNPTAYPSFGLWSRLHAAAESARSDDSVLQGVEDAHGLAQKTASEVQDLQGIGAAGREDARQQQFNESTTTPSQLASAVQQAANTPSAIAKALGPNRLWQAMTESPAVARGVTDFTDTGKSIVTMFENADPTTFVHEMAHVVRRLIPPDRMADIAEKLGVENWQSWTREEEEKFANMVVDRAVNGNTVPGMDAVLGKAQKDIANVYASLRGSQIGANVSPALKDFYEAKRNIDAMDRPVLTTDDEAQLKQAGQVVADAMSKGSDFSKALTDNGINLFRVNANDNILKLEGSISQFVQKYVAPHLNEVESRDAVLAQAQQAAQDIGVTDQQFLNRMSDVSEKAKGLSQSVLEAKLVLHTVMSNFNDAVQAAQAARTTDNAVRFLKSWDTVKQAMTLYRETSANVARGLGIFNVSTGPLDRLGQLEELSRRGGADKVWDLIDEANRINTITPPSGQMQAVRSMMEKNKWWNMLHEYRTNCLLGSTPGLGAELTSKAVKTLSMPFENALKAGFSMDPNGVAEGLSFYKALGNQLIPAWSAASKAFRLGTPVLDATLEHQNAIRASAFGLQDGGLGTAVNAIGTVLNLPARLRMAGDEFFKQLNYRAFMEMQFNKEAFARGITDPDGVDKFVANSLSQTIDQMGRGIVPPALSYARDASYGTPLTEGFAAGMNRLRYQPNPMSNVFRLAVPFFKVPVNIFNDVVGHTPLIGALLKDQREAITSAITSRDYTKAAGVMAKWSTGAAAMGMSSYLYNSGAITGRGSSDPATQKQMEMSGWQPYSVVYTDQNGNKNYVSFKRIEPWGSLLGIMADYMELGPSLQDADLHKTAIAAYSAVARNAMDKTYVKGLADLFDALSKPDENMEKYLASLSGSFAPSALKAFNNDPYLREVQSTLDAFKAKTPGYSQDLMPQRNLLGEPVPASRGWMLPDTISPFAFSQQVSDPVKRELAGLGNGFKNPGPIRYGQDYRQYTNDKGQTAQDRMMELVGTLTDSNGNTLSKSLNQLIKSKGYQQLLQVGDAGTPYRIKEIGQTLNRYQNAAEEKMLTEFPQLAAKVHLARIKKASDLFNAVQAEQMQQAQLQPQQ